MSCCFFNKNILLFHDLFLYVYTKTFQRDLQLRFCYISLSLFVFYQSLKIESIFRIKMIVICAVLKCIAFKSNSESDTITQSQTQRKITENHTKSKCTRKSYENERISSKQRHNTNSNNTTSFIHKTCSLKAPSHIETG